VRGNLINARGVEYDRNDGNFWIADFGGNIYKITGFEFVPPQVTGIREDGTVSTDAVLRFAPNPASTSTLVTLTSPQRDRIIDIVAVDVLGQPIATIFHGTQLAGEEITTRWYTSSIPPGTYSIIARDGSALITTARVSIVR
jgi:hypothetical protein